MSNFLNNHNRTIYDSRNSEALNHKNHECMELSRKWIKHLSYGGYEEINVICINCKKQFKVYSWNDVNPNEQK